MKKALIVIILSVLLLGLATYELIAVDKIISQLKVMAVQLQVEISENEDNVIDTSTSVDEVKSCWSKHEENLC